MTEQQQQIFEQIAEERKRQNDMHPEFPVDLRMDIWMEEVGEVARAKLEGDRMQMRKELIEAAAVAVRWIETMDNENSAEDQLQQAKVAFEIIRSLCKGGAYTPDARIYKIANDFLGGGGNELD